MDVLYRSTQVLVDENLVEAGILVSHEGLICRIVTALELASNYSGYQQVVDFGNSVLMPGLIDSHVHVNEPGRSEWEGFWTATQSAAAGGITTIIDMPLNSIPPTTTVKNLKTKICATEGKLHVDVGFWGGVIPGNQDDLKDLVNCGVVGFKCFLCPSGVDEFPHVVKEDVEKALQQLEGTNSILAFHAECNIEDPNITITDQGNPEKYITFLKSRPPKMEVLAVNLVAELALKYSVRCHIVHLSAAETLPIVQGVKAEGSNLTAETCHHYLTLSSENIPDQGVEYKCCPPVRDNANKESLWAALKSGILDMVVSDHSPCVPSLKYSESNSGDFMAAWGGISSLQFGLSLFWTEARKRGFDLVDVHRLMTLNPAKLAGLEQKKGRFHKGMDADFIVWNPDDSFTVEKSIILHKHKLTPYLGMKLYGRVLRTVVRGQTVFQQGHPFPPPRGQTLLNKSTHAF